MCVFGHRLAFWGARPAWSLGFWSHLHDSESRLAPLTQRPAGGLGLPPLGHPRLKASCRLTSLLSPRPSAGTEAAGQGDLGLYPGRPWLDCLTS